jgi:hypothetical protein
VLDKRRKLGFLGNKDYNFGPTPRPRWELSRWSRTPPPPSPLPLDDFDDFVASVFHVIQMVQQEVKQIEIS